MRGFAVVSTDTGHKSHGGAFDFGFMKDEQAYLDFAYLANAQVRRSPKNSSRSTTQSRQLIPISPDAPPAAAKA
jgi:hypothetical protein